MKIDDYFQQVAYSMGFKPQDILPIDQLAVQIQSANFTKGMSDKQREFYINKKMTTMLQRQNTIIRQIEKEIKKREFSYKLSADHNSKLHNPVVMKLLEQHEKMINNNKRYIDIIFRKKAIDKENEEKKRSISNKNQRLRESFNNNRSSVSSHSKQSVKSARSDRSSASNKQRLMMIRQKEKLESQMKKQLYKQKQRQDSKKFLSAMENISRKSQRAKTKIAISKQIVEENKKEIDLMKKAEIKEHFESLKFKIQRIQQIKTKNSQRKDLKFQRSNYKEIKQMADYQNQKLLKYRYDEKFRTASVRFGHQQLVRNEARNFSRMTQQLKLDNVRKTREYKVREQKVFMDNIMKYEQERLRTAEINRNAIKDLSRERHIEREIQRDMARKNVQSVNHRRMKETSQLRKKIDNKFSEIEEIDKIKRRLSKDRKKIRKNLNSERNSLEIGRYHPKFNDFFDI